VFTACKGLGVANCSRRDPATSIKTLGPANLAPQCWCRNARAPVSTNETGAGLAARRASFSLAGEREGRRDSSRLGWHSGWAINFRPVGAPVFSLQHWPSSLKGFVHDARPPAGPEVSFTPNSCWATHDPGSVGANRNRRSAGSLLH